MSEREEIEALKKELADFKRKYLDDYMAVLDVKIDLGTLRGDLDYAQKCIGDVSSFLGSRTSELRERLTALETHYFKRIEDFQEVDRIIGKPDDPSPPTLDNPPRMPRRK